MLQGGTHSPPHWEPLGAQSPLVLHSPTGTPPAQALPLATASWEKSSPSSGGPHSTPLSSCQWEKSSPNSGGPPQHSRWWSGHWKTNSVAE